MAYFLIFLTLSSGRNNINSKLEFILLSSVSSLLASSYSSQAAFNLKRPSSWSSDTTTKSCAVASSKKSTGLNDEPEFDVIREEAVHVTHFGVDGQVVCVETMNGSLLEYWV